MNNERLLSFIKSALQRSIESKDDGLTCQQLNAMVQVMTDRIAELERENTAFKLQKRYTKFKGLQLYLGIT